MGSTENPQEYQQLLNVSFGDETDLFHTKVSDREVLLVKHQRSLHCFRLESTGAGGVSWKVLWSRDGFFDDKQREFGSSFFVAEAGWMLVRNREGLQFYRMEGSDLTPRHYCSDGRYRDMYGWNDPSTVFLMGHMYAADGAAIGVLTRNKRGAIRFEQMVESVVLKGGSQPLWKLHDLPNLPVNWKLNSTQLSLAFVDRTPQAAIIERSASEISVYKLNESYHPQMVGLAKGVPFSNANSERILFGNIVAANEYRDMLQLNAAGLMLYRQEGTAYRPVWQSRKPITGGSGLEKKHWNTAALIDVDRDGKDDLWLTGPQGIVGFKVTEANAESVLFGQSYSDDVRYARILAILSDGENPRAVAVGGRQLLSFILTPSKELAPGTGEDGRNAYPASQTSEDIEPIFVLNTHSGPVVEASLAEQLDTSLLFDPINPMNGQLEFGIPLLVAGKLFNLPTAKFITYQESSSTPGPMGVGWSLQVDCVYIDRRNSIFPENHRYYLVRDGSTSFISPKTTGNNEEITAFSIAANNQTSITFNRPQNQWIMVDGNGESFYYGTHGANRVVQMDTGSEDWPFAIDRKASNTQLPSVWYLIRHSDRADQWIEYSYTKAAQTNDYRLAAITTSNEASLTLSYSAQFQKTLFTGFTLRTRRYVQTAALHYTVQEEKVRLKRISQQNKTVLEFSYDGPGGVMSEIIYPNGLVAKFDYTVLQIDRNVLMNRFETYSHPKTAYGPTYLLIADITKNEQVRIRIRDALGSDTVPVAGSAIPLLGKLPVVDYEMFTGESHFSVLLHHTGSHAELCLFETQADVWQSIPTYIRLPKDTSIHSGQDFLLAKQHQRVTVIERQNGKWRAQKPFDIEQSSLLYFFSHGFLTYNDRQLQAFVRRDEQWTPAALQFPVGLLESSSAVFESFEHPQEMIDNLKKGIRLDALGMYHNVVAFRSLHLQGSKLYARLRLLHLNWRHEVSREKVIDILIEDLDTYTFNPPEADGNTFVFGYRFENGKFRLKVIQHRGKIMDEIEKIKDKIEQDIREHPDAPEEEKQRYRNESHEKLNSELQELYRNITAQIPFAIDPSKFGMIVNDAHIVTASHKVQYDGVEWTTHRIPQEELTMDSVSINLGPAYRLVKAHRNATFELVHSESSALKGFDTETNNGTALHIRYPSFMAVQLNDSAVQLFNFQRDELTSLPDGEMFDSNSNSLAIISSTADGKSLLIRSMDSFGVTRQNVVWRHEFTDGRMRKLTNIYEFNAQTAQPYEAGFLMRDVKITPVSSEGRYGWFRVHYDFANSTRSTKSAYNSAGEFVKLVDTSDAEPKKTLDPDGVLMARDGHTIVADFRPYRISREVVTYYGFEPYEQNLIGTGGRWSWNGGVVRSEHNNHFLHLKRSASVTALVQPKMEFGTLVVSCWLRGSTEPQHIGSKLTVQYNGKTVHGSIGFIAGGWTYVEAVVENTDKFQVKISPGTDGSLDVDHLRVLPTELDLKVHIYDTALALERSTLHASGLLSHRLYDALGNEIAQIDERGSIENLSFFSRTKNTRIEMRPALGEVLRAAPGGNVYSGSFRYVPDTVVLRFRFGAVERLGTVRIAIASREFKMEFTDEQSSLTAQSNRVKIPREGDLVIFCSGTHYSIWIDGQLQGENVVASATHFNRYDVSSTNAQIWDVMLLYDVSVKTIYLSDFGKPEQILELKEPSTVAVQEIVFDDLNRPAVKTKWTELDGANSSVLFAHRRNFIENETRFWRTGQMEGMVATLNIDCEGVPYSRTVYADHPLEERTVQSFPGKPFAIDGPFAKHYSDKQRIDFLENLFPSADGFYYESERYPDQSIYVTVHSRRKLKAAEYVRTRQGDHHLTTFEYDASDRLVLQLPPSYHEQADTFSRTSPFFGGSFSPADTELQRAWGTWYEYDPESGLMTLKRTPDTGNTRYLHTPEGFLRFVLQENSTNVMYFTYSSVGKLTQRGIVELDVADLSKYLPNDSNLPASSNFLLLDHGGNDVAPLHRHRVENIRKISNDHILSDLLLFDHQGQLITSALYSNTNVSLAIGYKYRKNQIHELHYPATVKGKNFRLRYSYDHRGKLTSIANAATNEKFVLLENNSLGLPRRMIVQPNTPHTYQRTFAYNQPGYLTKIEDPYLTETIDYAGTGYGGRPIGDGTVQATRFKATWHAHSAARHLKLKPSHLGTGRRAKICFDALTSAGYIDALGRPLKTLYPLLELRLPVVCGLGTYGHKIAAVLNGQGFPENYGHRYDYGNHRQLIRAKYYQSTTEARYNPLRSETFGEVNGISAGRSTDIWHKLRGAGFLHSDCSTGAEHDCHGLPGKSIFHPTIANHAHTATLSSLMARSIRLRKDVTRNAFDQLCPGWFKDDFPDTIQQTCNTIWTMLAEAKFVGANSNGGMNAISPELRDLLSEYASSLPEIVGLLHDKFATALGHSSADVQSFTIDANGNHRHFYTGFRRYRLEYVKNTNKIVAVYRTIFASSSGLEETRFELEHNEDGSVTRAMHKDIQRIVYDPLLNRATDIMMTDGTRLKFDYNARGHRLYKHVHDRTGRLIRKKYYLRDVQGKPLVEYDADYGAHKEVDNATPIVRATVFLYADDRLVGFIRNDQFYSVTLDHEGSVRLVIKNGEIVAAYDYLPYGELLRSFGEDTDGHLDYRFTGKEWDKETNLYDFHARLYDPELGRFLQMDPKEQYASPYLYAGNSPVSLVDPDGQFAFLIVALVVGGAYLGAASANNSWNPAKWNLKKALIGGLIGAAIGGLAPAGIAGSVTFLSGYIGATAAIGVVTATSVGFAYLSLSSANGSWDPSKWDWSKPGTWNALFVGSLSGATLFNAVGGVHKAFVGYTGLTRTAFVIVTSGTTSGFLIYSGSLANDGNLRFWEWDWSKPGTVWGAVEGAAFGLSISPKLHSATQQVAGRLENLKEIGKSLKANDFDTASKLLIEEAKAYKQIFTSVMNGDVVQDAIKAGKAAGQPGGTILIPKIPDGAMKVIDNILLIEKVLPIFKKKPKRSVQLSNTTILSGSSLDSFHFKRLGANLELGQLEYDISFSNDVLMVVSSGSKITNWLNNILGEVLGTMDKRGKSENVNQRSITPFTRREEHTRKTFSVPNCFQFSSQETTYGNSQIVCYEKYGISHIFSHDNTVPQTEDHYSLCFPLEYEGYSSVACRGKTSSYIFTPYKGAVNYLDHLNGTLTLFLVAPAIVRNFASFIRTLISNNETNESKEKFTAQTVTKREQVYVDRKFKALLETVQEYRGLTNSPGECSWIENIIADIEEDVGHFLSQANPSCALFQQLCDRMQDFDEELTESKQIITYHSYAGEECMANNLDTNFQTSYSSKIDVSNVYNIPQNSVSYMRTVIVDKSFVGDI